MLCFLNGGPCGTLGRREKQNKGRSRWVGREDEEKELGGIT